VGLVMNKIVRRSILFVASIFLLTTLILAVWVNQQGPKPVILTPSLTGEPEYCLTCHADLPEISPSHPIETFGCVICHGGERLALEADLAHSTMRGGRNPSDLAVVEASCGGSNCHSGSAEENRDHIQRVLTSIQATYAGAIASVRYTFGAQADPIARLGISAVQDHIIETSTGLASLEAFDPSKEDNPSVLNFAQNCLHCHLSADPLPGPEYGRLTGCAACHTLTAGRDLDQPIHQLTTAIPYTQCNTCHNQGNYDLGDMQFHARTDQPVDRLQDYYQPIAQFTKCEYELDCVDCHTAEEAMGDGDLHSNKLEVEYVRCYTCHGTLNDLPETVTIEDPDEIALRRAFLNPVVDLQVGDEILATERGEPLWNVKQKADGRFEMIAKETGTRYDIPVVKRSGCEQNPDEQGSKYCHACHAVER
jgi:ssDNA-binding Zn-finger/Zn-ribbon topoisomerase 1